MQCAEQGTELGWLIDPDAESILTLSSESQIKLFRGTQSLPVLTGLDLSLCANDVFSESATQVFAKLFDKQNKGWLH